MHHLARAIPLTQRNRTVNGAGETVTLPAGGLDRLVFRFANLAPSFIGFVDVQLLDSEAKARIRGGSGVLELALLVCKIYKDQNERYE